MNGQCLRLSRRLSVLLLPVVLVLSGAGCSLLNGPPGSDDDPGNGGPLPEPEIEVWRDGQYVFQGASCDYGEVCVDTSRSMVFTIVNNGTAELNLTGTPEKVETSGAGASWFTVTSQPSSPLAPNESTSFVVCFSTDTAEDRTATVTIASDDPDSNPYTFTVTGTGLVPPAKVPATGQTTSYTTGDDGDLEIGVGWPAPRFVDNGDGTTTDNLTGLMWETTPSSSSRQWENALSYANNLDLGTHTDWRLANINELMSLVNAEAATPASWLNGHDELSGVRSDQYWTSNISITTSTLWGWVVHMDTGILGRQNISAYGSFAYAWAVRDAGGGAVAIPKTGKTSKYRTGDDGDLQKGVSWPAPRFVDYGNGIITDNLTGLMWEQAPEAVTKSWSDALAYAAGLTLGEYSDWRLPNRNELRSLVDYGSAYNTSSLGWQGFSQLQADNYYWTSTTYAPATGSAWVVFIEEGHAGDYSKTGSCYAWAVRGGQ
jgi:hypothetical protein